MTSRRLTSSGRRLIAVIALVGIAQASCVRPTPRAVTPATGLPEIAFLWLEPLDLESRDLYHGPGGQALAPRPAANYTFVAADTTGYSDGYDVRGPDGMVWSVKLGPEAQPEVVSSRVLWAIGFHQVPTYYLQTWTMAGGVAGVQSAGRFRPSVPGWTSVADWSWYENEFVETRPFKGLIVANVILNNWDWKTSNNKVYDIANPGDGPRRRYVVRDLGASLGKTSFPAMLNFFPMRGLGQGSRNDLEGFESQGLLKSAQGGELEFDYRGIHRPMLDSLTAADVAWACQLLARLSDAQWQDAFRAAGYSEDHGRRYAKKIKEKVAEGLALAQS